MHLTPALDDDIVRDDLSHLIPALSTTLCRTGGDELDGAIETALGRVARALDLTCAALIESDAIGAPTHTAGWPAAGDADAGAAVPWALLTARDTPGFERVPDRLAERTGLRSALLLRVTVGG